MPLVWSEKRTSEGRESSVCSSHYSELSVVSLLVFPPVSFAAGCIPQRRLSVDDLPDANAPHPSQGWESSSPGSTLSHPEWWWKMCLNLDFLLSQQQCELLAPLNLYQCVQCVASNIIIIISFPFFKAVSRPTIWLTAHVEHVGSFCGTRFVNVAFLFYFIVIIVHRSGKELNQQTYLFFRLHGGWLVSF